MNHLEEVVRPAWDMP